VSYYHHRGDFLSDLGSGISKVSSFASFIPGVGTAVSGIGSLIGGGISAIGSLFGGGGPPPMSDAAFGSSLNFVNQATELAKRFGRPMTSPGAPVMQSPVYPETRPPVEFYASTPDVDYSDEEEEDYY
jgi:hypothetical protein